MDSDVLLCLPYQILLTPRSAAVIVLGIIVALLSMLLAKYMQDVEHESPYIPFLIWIIATRIGDAVLVCYPWSLCQPSLFRSRRTRKITVAIVAIEIATESVFLLAPSDRENWEKPSHTSTLYRVLVTVHYVFYFVAFYIVPYQIASSPQFQAHLRAPSFAPGASHTLVEDLASLSPSSTGHDRSHDTSDPRTTIYRFRSNPDLPISPTGDVRLGESEITLVVARRNSSQMIINELEKPANPARLQWLGSSWKRCSWRGLFQSYLVGYAVVLYVLGTTLAPILSGFNVFKYGPIFAVLVLLSLYCDRDKLTLAHDMGYCMIFPAIQLAVHALPTFFVQSLFRNSHGTTQNVYSTVGYYIIIACYGNVLRVVAFYATSARSHVALLLLFQVIDVIFSNMVFIGVHEFNAVYALLVLLTITRIFMRDSKFPNDVLTACSRQPRDYHALAALQCTRVRRARQNFILEVASAFIVPMLFLVDYRTGWNIVVRRTEQFPSQQFLAISSGIILVARITGCSLSWIYLRSQAAYLIERVEREQQAKEAEHARNKAASDSNDIEFEASETTGKWATLSSLHIGVTSTDVLRLEEGREDKSGRSSPVVGPSANVLVQVPQDSYLLLKEEHFRLALRDYWNEHFAYLLLCVAYGVLNAVMFISKVNNQMLQAAEQVADPPRHEPRTPNG